jgi:general secretion pathway protein F
MAAYEYKALDAGGRQQRGVQEGDSPRQIRQLLRDQGLLPVSVTEVSDTPKPRTFEFSLPQPDGRARHLSGTSGRTEIDAGGADRS